MPEVAKKAPEHAGAGHRERLRQRLLKGGAEALADYELLEYLLFATFRQGDTKPLAKALIDVWNRAGMLPVDRPPGSSDGAAPKRRRATT